LEQSRLIKTIVELNTREREQFSLFVSSPYYNLHKKTTEFLDIVLKQLQIGKLELLEKAVEVLAEEVHQYRYFVGTRNAWNDKGHFVLSRLSKGTLWNDSWPQAIRAVNANHIARSAVDAADKNRNG
jgi:hypothetical protein